MRQLPPDVQREITETAETLDAEQTAALADKYFGKDGKPLHASAASVNAVDEETPGLVDTEDEDGDTNAIGHRTGPRGPFTPAFSSSAPRRGSSNFRGRGGAPRTPYSANKWNNASQDSQRPRGPPRPSGQSTHPAKTAWLCRFHHLYGDNARSCQPGCSRAPKDQAGRRA